MSATSKNQSETVVTTKLTTILAIDLCGFSTLMEQDETRAIKAVAKLERLIDGTARRLNGRLFHRAGDGFLAEFKTTKEAYLAAQDILEKRREYQIRLGIHVGDVQVQRDGNLLGHTVNVAVRLQETTDPDTLILSRQSYNLISGLDKNTFDTEREVHLKNVSNEFAVYEVSRRQLKQKRFKDRWKQWAAIPVIFILVFFCTWLFLDNSRYENDQKNREQLLAQALNRYNKHDELDRQYISQLLYDLDQSKTSTAELILSLIENNRLSDAISALETEIESITNTADPRYEKLLHYIGAITYQTDISRSKRAYEIILELNPDDTQAHIRLGRVLDINGEAEAALESFNSALQSSKDIETKTWLSLDIAFSNMNLQNNEKALEIFENLYVQIGADIDIGTRIASKVYTDLGVAYYLNEDFEKVEKIVDEAMLHQEEYGHYYDLSRSHGLKGYFYFEGRRSLKNRTLELEHAEDHYNKQLKYASEMRNFRAVSDANTMLARIYMEKTKYGEAWKYIHKAKLGKAGPVEEFKILITQAELELAENKKIKSCKTLRDAKDLHDKIQTKIGPDTIKRIRKLNCSVEF